jgi:hypothetical protein
MGASVKMPAEPQWSVEELEACFVVRDDAGQKVAFIYFEDDPVRRLATKLPTHGEAQQIAGNIAKLLSGLLRRP